MVEQVARVKWEGHTREIFSYVSQLRLQNASCDCILRCSGGEQLPAHKVMLAVASPLLRKLLVGAPQATTPINHQVIILDGVEAAHVEVILQYIYQGQALVRCTNLSVVSKIARALEITEFPYLEDVPPGTNSTEEDGRNCPVNFARDRRHSTGGSVQKSYSKLASSPVSPFHNSTDKDLESRTLPPSRHDGFLRDIRNDKTSIYESDKFSFKNYKDRSRRRYCVDPYTTPYGHKSLSRRLSQNITMFRSHENNSSLQISSNAVKMEYYQEPKKSCITQCPIVELKNNNRDSRDDVFECSKYFCNKKVCDFYSNEEHESPLNLAKDQFENITPERNNLTLNLVLERKNNGCWSDSPLNLVKDKHENTYSNHNIQVRNKKADNIWSNKSFTERDIKCGSPSPEIISDSSTSNINHIEPSHQDSCSLVNQIYSVRNAYSSGAKQFDCNSIDRSLTSSSTNKNSEDPMLMKITTPKRNRFRFPKSWEFLLRLLRDPDTNPSLIRWENEKEGIFKLIDPEAIAVRWGKRTEKHNKEILCYENFARGLRYHYRTGALTAVSERSFVYQFGPKVLLKPNEDNGKYIEKEIKIS